MTEVAPAGTIIIGVRDSERTKNTNKDFKIYSPKRRLPISMDLFYQPNSQVIEQKQLGLLTQTSQQQKKEKKHER